MENVWSETNIVNEAWIEQLDPDIISRKVNIPRPVYTMIYVKHFKY